MGKRSNIQDKMHHVTNSSMAHHPARRVVALTGTDSFLGRNLVGLMEEDSSIGRIVALDVCSPRTAGAKTRFYEIDLTQPASEERLAEILSAERVQTLVHLAFLSSPTPVTAWAHEFESLDTMYLIHAMRQAAVPKLVHWSHSWLYGANRSNPNFLPEIHPLEAREDFAFLQDKIEAEKEALRFGEQPNVVSTVLRTAPILGPTVRSVLTRYLSRPLVPTLMGFDPLWQFVHEADAVAAFKHAIDKDFSGVFNIASEGVLPLSTVIRLAGRLAVPLPRPVALPLMNVLWSAQLAEYPPQLLDYLRYLCVVDTDLAAKKMGFRSTYTAREAVLDFATAQHLRDVRLLNDKL
jgi:UDP-glucose 4-epimerase